MASLTKDALLAAAAGRNLPRERVDCPELGAGEYVWVRGMTGRERDEFERSNYKLRRGKLEIDMDKIGNARARLAVRCLVDDNGTRLFENDDADALGGLRADTLSRIYEAAQRLSNVTDEDLNELKKSSESAAGDGSSSS